MSSTGVPSARNTENFTGISRPTVNELSTGSCHWKVYLRTVTASVAEPPAPLLSVTFTVTVYAPAVPYV